MKYTIVVAVLVVMLSGCANRMVVRNADGSAILHDRVVEVLKSDLPPEQKAHVIEVLLEREKDQGSNLLAGWKDIFAWLATAGIVIAR